MATLRDTCTLFALYFLGIVLCCSPPALAERHAVLIGIKDYQPPVRRLYGPVNDVESLRRVLVESYNFSSSNIEVLLNHQAEKGRIMEALRNLTSRTKPGDFIFIYFSGHGTSARDPSLALPIGYSTGALVPYDFKLDKKNVEKTISSLIVGNRDLRPVISELDKDRKLLVIFDTCFSENAVRSAYSRAMPKRLDLGLFSEAAPTFKPVKKEPYPYRNTLYIAAADEADEARDLQRSSYDGKAHGALTETLLIGLDGRADSNNNGIITYEELYQFAKRETNEKYGHSPQRYTDGSMDLEGAVFEQAAKPATETPGARSEAKTGLVSPSQAPLKVKVQGNDTAALSARLKTVPNVELVDGEHDILLSAEKNNYTILLPGGEKLCSLRHPDEAVSRVRRYVKLRELVGLKNPHQNFNVWLRAGDTEGRTVFRAGDKVDFTVRSEEPAYLLLLDIDPMGNVTVLIPDNMASRYTVSRDRPLELKARGEVCEPLGVDFLKLFAFRKEVSALEHYASGDGVLSIEGNGLAKLLDLIKQQEDWAETVQMVVTVK